MPIQKKSSKVEYFNNYIDSDKNKSSLINKHWYDLSIETLKSEKIEKPARCIRKLLGNGELASGRKG